MFKPEEFPRNLKRREFYEGSQHSREFKQALNKTFARLRRSGFTARQNFLCCQGCACAQLGTEGKKKYAFYHNQDAARMYNDLSVYIAYSNAADGAVIVHCAEECGLLVFWDGTEAHRIRVAHPFVMQQEAQVA